MATTKEGRRRHVLYLDYEGGWLIGELQDWLEDALALGADRSSVVRSRARGTLGPSGLAGLEVLLPLPARDAGPEPEEPATASAPLADGSAGKGGG